MPDSALFFGSCERQVLVNDSCWLPLFFCMLSVVSMADVQAAFRISIMLSGSRLGDEASSCSRDVILRCHCFFSWVNTSEKKKKNVAHIAILNPYPAVSAGFSGALINSGNCAMREFNNIFKYTVNEPRFKAAKKVGLQRPAEQEKRAVCCRDYVSSSSVRRIWAPALLSFSSSFS